MKQAAMHADEQQDINSLHPTPLLYPTFWHKNSKINYIYKKPICFVTEHVTIFFLII